MAEATESTQQNVQQNVQQAENEQKSSSVDYSKIEAMINKGTAQKESAILKSYFEQQGLSDAEMTEAIKAYKSNKQKAAAEKETAYSNMQKENEALKQQIFNSQLNAKASAIAKELGFDDKAIDYAVRLADFSKAANDKHELVEEEIKKALEQVKSDLPALAKKSEEATSFRFGADSNSNDINAQNELKKLFGVKVK